MLRGLIIFCLITGTFTSGPFYRGRCPSPTVEPVDLERYAGEWREYQTNQNNWDNASRCTTSFWTKPENEVSTVFVTGIPTIGGDNSTIIGKGANNDRNLGVTFHFPVLGALYDEYWVLNTDYENYSITFACTDHGLFSTIKLYIFTREKVPALDVQKIGEETYKNYGLPIEPMVTIDQNNCPDIY
ncbi:apolipoprotein D [Microplitis demolitor]|uniref:apolipoprotein D n=1 Tax=Microplitis demolitor TaxID=69319 RepID=UPI0004CCFFEA|nr:apolipoprotein D [Microplitis demolitor]